MIRFKLYFDKDKETKWLKKGKRYLYWFKDSNRPKG